MPTDVHTFVWQTLNADPTLRSLWTVPVENPYLDTASQGSGGGPGANSGGGSCYTIIQDISQIVSPTLDNPQGPGNTWIMSFTSYSQGTSTASGAMIARLMAQRIVDVLQAAVRPVGLQEVIIRNRVSGWLEEERFYRVILDLELTETLACT